MKPYIIFILLLLCMAVGLTAAEPLYKERLYEPVVMQSGPLYGLIETPVNELFLYAYDAAAASWRLMPFQIDERVRTEDPFKPGNSSAWRHTYFSQEDGIFDDEDELVFMVRDLGDQAPDYVWIDDADSRNHSRLELSFYDANAPDNKAYAYIYRSISIKEPVPTPYEFQYDMIKDQIETKQYGVAIDKDNGLIKDIFIKPPYGTGVDFFDTQKLRFSGVIDLFYPINLEADESIFYLYEYRKVTQKPIVRLIRETRETIKIWSEPEDSLVFYVTTKFYPFSGTVDGGEKLDVESLRQAFPGATDLYIYFKYLRQSWDFNANSQGMHFYSRLNQDVLIDGKPDLINTTVDLPIREWAMASGAQGSFFTYSQFPDTVAQSMGLYYWDSIKGSPLDSADVGLPDTGDKVSYGDQGLFFKNVKSLRLGFKVYFLPANMNKNDGENIAYSVANPVKWDPAGRTVNFPTKVSGDADAAPIRFELEQNYPNPFNNSTTIRFRLQERGPASLRVVDTSGRVVALLVDQIMNSGAQQITWNGRDQQNQEVASGMYFFELKTGRQLMRKSMVLLR